MGFGMTAQYYALARSRKEEFPPPMIILEAKNVLLLPSSRPEAKFKAVVEGSLLEPRYLLPLSKRRPKRPNIDDTWHLPYLSLSLNLIQLFSTNMIIWWSMHIIMSTAPLELLVLGQQIDLL